MSQSDLLIGAVEALERAGVGYMLTGSLASSIQGEPRATHDVDLVIEVDFTVVDGLAVAFGAPRFYFDSVAARSALDARGMFNLLDIRTGDKVDFWALTATLFDVSRFARRTVTRAFGREISISSPEDTILQKLKWAVDSGGSERHFNDAAAVYEVQAGALDEAYLSEWADRLGVTDLLVEVRSAAT
jgi:hypothetical protein